MYQKKRKINNLLEKLLCSNVSLRRSAIILNISRHTAEKKLIFLAKRAQKRNHLFLKSLEKNKAQNIQFDDLITKENTKLKPLSVSLAVDQDRGYIFGGFVSVIPSFGHLAHISRKKYGHRECQHREGLLKLFQQMRTIVSVHANFRSDEHKRYREMVDTVFPFAVYKQFPSSRACVAGQGELKKKLFDPLFCINHTCAMLRANINRLIRKTWCTTKCIDRLQMHLTVFISFFNQYLLKIKRGRNKFSIERDLNKVVDMI